MQAYRPDRVVRVLSALVSFAYFAFWVGGVIVLLGSLGLKLFAGDDRVWTWGLPIPATVRDTEPAVITSWGSARLEVEDVRASLKLPIAILPWWFFAVLWAHAAGALAMMLFALHHLRRIFERVRAGEPFDANNAQRLRWVGLMLFALTLLNGVAEHITAVAVRQGLTTTSISVPSGFNLDGSVVVFSLLLIALAEIFRRGSQLEHEQSLVV
jgi:hypothetical protein